jgi:arylsulfatase A-like enzyme/thioredoxin-like negative regulator of GroEL
MQIAQVSRWTRLAAAGVALAAAFAGDPARAADKPPVLLVTIDTLRSDRLPVYGFDGVETPAIDAFAKDSILFEHAYSHVPLTLPSHLTILTGLLPGEHGVRDNSGYRFDARKHGCLPLDLKPLGYRTAATVSTFVLRNETGIDACFDSYDGNLDPGMLAGALAAAQRSGKDSVASALAWIAKNGDQPFFYFLHLYEPHTPYEPIEPFATKYAKDKYLGEIATADSYLATLFSELKKMGVYDRALILLMSDHGEGLNDHGEAEHGIFVYREAIQVPMMVKLPNQERAGQRVANPAQLTDVYPTVAAFVGAKVPKELKGASLLTLDSIPPRLIYSETFYQEIHYGWSPLQSLIQFPFHLISGPDPELYEVAKDPAEKSNLRDSERRTLNTLRQSVKTYEKPLAQASKEDAETAAKLAALGYLGTTAAKPASGALPDPKSQMPLIADFKEASTALQAQRFADAAVRFDALTKAAPNMTEAWTMMASALQKMGRIDEAIAALQKAMQLTGGSPTVAMSLAGIYSQLGKLDEAQKHAEVARSANPVQAAHLLARIAISRKDYTTAEKEARSAMAAGGSRVATMVLLTEILLRQEKIDEALKVSDDALAELDKIAVDDKSYRGIYILRGELMRKKGRNSEAIEAYKNEILAFPEEPFAYSRLARTYAAIGRRDDAFRTVQSMILANPDDPTVYVGAVVVLQQVRMFPDADRLMKEALRKFPQDPRIRNLSERRYLGTESSEDANP